MVYPGSDVKPRPGSAIGRFDCSQGAGNEGRPARRERPPCESRRRLSVGNEGNDVSIGIADLEIGPAPRLRGRHLGELRATVFELLEEPVNVGDLDKKRRYDCVIVAVAHHQFKGYTLDAIKRFMNSNPVLIDVRRMFDPAKAKQKGFTYYTL